MGILIKESCSAPPLHPRPTPSLVCLPRACLTSSCSSSFFFFRNGPLTSAPLPGSNKRRTGRILKFAAVIQTFQKFRTAEGNYDDDLLMESLSFIHVSEMMLFQCVCQRWRKVLKYAMVSASAVTITSRFRMLGRVEIPEPDPDDDSIGTYKICNLLGAVTCLASIYMNPLYVHVPVWHAITISVFCLEISFIKIEFSE